MKTIEKEDEKLSKENEGDYDNNNNYSNNNKNEYIPPHRAKLIQIPENGIQLPFNIITATHNSQQTEKSNSSNNLILSTSQYKFPRKTSANATNLSSNKSVNIPIETEFKSNFKGENIVDSNNSTSNTINNTNMKPYAILNNQSKFPSSSSFIDNNSNNNNAINQINISNQKKPSLFV